MYTSLIHQLFLHIYLFFHLYMQYWVYVPKVSLHIPSLTLNHKCIHRRRLMNATYGERIFRACSVSSASAVNVNVFSNHVIFSSNSPFFSLFASRAWVVIKNDVNNKQQIWHVHWRMKTERRAGIFLASILILQDQKVWKYDARLRLLLFRKREGIDVRRMLVQTGS